MMQRNTLPSNKIMVNSILPMQAGTEIVSQNAIKGPKSLRRIESVPVEAPIPAKVEQAISVSPPVPSQPVSHLQNIPAKPRKVPKIQVSLKKFPDPVTFTSSSDSNPPPAVLVVGGTDGSGTRRVVQVLTELGVKMVSEDPETYDIHGDLMGGWPPIVKAVLSHTHTINYDPSLLDSKLHNKVSADLHRLLDQVRKDSVKVTSHRLGVGGVLPRPSSQLTARHISYGFKAPVAMTLLPYWSYLEDSLRFIHCVRDGRDIAFSANQGPVDKFYSDMYSKHLDLMRLSQPLKGVKLWSDWNVAAYTWSKRRATQHDNDDNNNNKGKFFGYFLLHSEDLISSNRQVRFMSIYHLSRFVGSDISNHDICCLAMAEDTFMGSHDRTQDKSSQQLQSRYGKWKAQTEHNPQLRKDLYRYGHDGLALLGYDPLRVEIAPEDHMRTEDGYQCDLTPDQCSKASSDQGGGQDSFISAPEYAIPGQCEAAYGFDYIAADLTAITLLDTSNNSNSNKSGCCQQCLSNPQCRVFTLDPSTSICYLKTQDLGKKIKKHLISGRVITIAAV